MSSGYYLGELLRLALLDLYNQGLIFKGQDVQKLKEAYIMDTSYPSRIEDDPFENLEDTDELFQADLGIQTTVQERKLIRRLCELIGTRSARLSVCGIAAICQREATKPPTLLLTVPSSTSTQASNKELPKVWETFTAGRKTSHKTTQLSSSLPRMVLVLVPLLLLPWPKRESLKVSLWVLLVLKYFFWNVALFTII